MTDFVMTGQAWLKPRLRPFFEREEGIDNGLLGRWFAAACEKAGTARRTVKETRHTFATLGLVRNVPVKVISEALKHASAKMTYDIYSQVIAGLQEDSLSHLDGLFAALWGATVTVLQQPAMLPHMDVSVFGVRKPKTETSSVCGDRTSYTVPSPSPEFFFRDPRSPGRL